MNEKRKFAYLIVIILVGVFIAGIVILNDTWTEGRFPSVKEYTLQWTFYEGELIQLDTGDLLFDSNDVQLAPTYQDDDTLYYELPKGEYKLLTTDYLNTHQIEIKVVIRYR